MLRVRFQSTADDPRPVNWPIKHPYWITGEGEGYHVVVAYADDMDYIYANWPEAENYDAMETDHYTFNGRFPKPDWMK